MKNDKNPTALVILDGFGYSSDTAYNAILTAQTPHFDSWLNSSPHAFLKASGEAVGLPQGNIGNSEVGHMTMGSGRVIEQPVSIIHRAIDDGSFFKNQQLNSCLKQTKMLGGRLHLMGLLSDASVHSNIKHLFAFLDTAQQHNITDIFVHPFLDGRDTPPQSARIYLEQLDKKIRNLGTGTIASLHGRFYAMDRDKNWERTEQSYRTLTEEQKAQFTSWQETLQDNYANNVTDEFIPPTQLNSNGIVKSNDTIIFFNFRPDRARQLTAAFVDPTFDAFPTKKIELTYFITPVSYNSKLNTQNLLVKKPGNNTLTETLSNHDKRIFTIAETEKYAHVTYFFNGGREQTWKNETRVLIPSIPARNYIDIPEMSAKKITNAVLQSLTTKPYDFYLINYANADMVGHSGNMEATVKAVECLDKELQKLYTQIVEKMDGTLYITADHGNAEQMFDEKTGQPHTAHTTNKVPFIMINKKSEGSSQILPLTQLADIAPFILKNMGIKAPEQMTRKMV